jgi:protein associated with RNAse G/E
MALVPMSATSNLVPMGRSSTILFEQHSRKWQTRIGMCFYFSKNTGILAIAMQA